MSKGITPIAQSYYEVTNVKHTTPPSLCYTEPILTWLPDSIKDKGKEGISLQELEKRLNQYKRQQAKGKINNSGFLKGLYTGYFKGVNCTTSAPYLCFDIDVKSNYKQKENTHLLKPLNNHKIFEALKKISVLCWRSNSQNGIAGVLYVPQIAQYTNESKDLHKLVGTSITDYLQDYLHTTTGVDKIKFDEAQSKFRQVRLIAEQKEFRKLNPKPFMFSYTVEKKVKQTRTGIVKYRDKHHRQPAGTIFEQYDNNNSIFNLMQQIGFIEVATSDEQIRVKHNLSDSSTTGVVDKSLNVYFNYSSTLGGQTSFTPSRLMCYFKFNNDWQQFKQHLEATGLKDKVATKKQVKSIAKSLKDELQTITNEQEASKIIFKHCSALQTSTVEVKKQFIKDNCTRSEHKQYFIEYLKLADYQIKFDKQLTINRYVSEVLPEVLSFADKHERIVLRAETGKGKTTAFVRYFHKHRPNARLLILAPLTIIVDQNRKEYKDKGVFLTGLSDMIEHIEAMSEKIVFATYEQGVKCLEASTFDYIVIDEIHQLITANSFKRDVIAELTPLLNGNKLIGLTGTPTQIFHKLNFKLLDVDVKNPKQTPIEVRYLNTKAFNIVMSHLSQRQTGKVLIRLNEIETIKALIKQLVATELYKGDEVLFLHSTNEIKKSEDYTRLAHNRQFNSNYKLIFTTSLIDEGLSIEQSGFTDVVFIETNYNPRPEPIKQFFARFRNEAPERKNYLYLRKKNNQQATRFEPELMFVEDLKLLEQQTEQQEAKEVLTTYKNLFSNNSYYYSDATVNPYYLAFAVTEVLFKYFNASQFLEYLQSNYNLSFTINKNFEATNIKAFDPDYSKKQKQKIAQLWIDAKAQILQVLYYHTQDPHIRNGINKTQTVIEPDVLKFAVSNIKHFEQLFTRTNELRCLGVKDTLQYLTKIDEETTTLQSNENYNKAIMLLRIEKAIQEPETKADTRTAMQIVSFAQWCELKGVFSSRQMHKQLKRLGVINHRAFSEKMLFSILEWHDIKAQRNKKNNLINCSKKSSTNF